MRRLLLALALSLPILLCYKVNAFSSTKLLCLVNQERVKYGLAPLGMDRRLNASAQRHSNYQARSNVMTHDENGTDPGTRVSQAGFHWSSVAENVAFGMHDEESCMKSWMNSPGHRANILGHYKRYGSAMAVSANGSMYYTQDFGTEMGEPGDERFPVCPDENAYQAAPRRHHHTRRKSHSVRKYRHHSHPIVKIFRIETVRKSGYGGDGQ